MKAEHVTPFTALVLAGTRGRTDPVAEAAGYQRKALVPIAGVPMLVLVIRALRASEQIGGIVVSSDDPAILDGIPELRELTSSGALSGVRCGRSPSASVIEHLRRLGARQPLLVTTADHPLLTTEMVDYFCAAARRSCADVAVAAVAASLFRRRYPQSRRTFIPLRGESFSGANLFGFLTPEAGVAAEFWAGAEAFRKHPWRLARLFGSVSLALFVLGRLDLEAALARASRTIGARISVVEMPYPECAIDVDGPEDLALAARILSGGP